MDDQSPPADGPGDDPVETTPTVSCSRCGREWELSYELDELHAGNRAVEQFAMDHYRHTGHYPDDVSPWQIECQHCPEREQFLAERPARRFASTHVRHTNHTVELRDPETESEQIHPSE